MMPDPGVGKFPPNEENVRSVIEELMAAKFKVLSALCRTRVEVVPGRV